MGYPKSMLAEDEEVVLETHPHWKTLVIPVLQLLVVLGIVGFLLAWLAPGWQRWTAVGVGSALVLVVFVVPFLRWRTTLFVITTKRVVTREGILTRSGRDIPLNRINDVSFHHNVVERILRCGSLNVESAGERGQVVLEDIPRVASVHHALYELIEKAGRE